MKSSFHEPIYSILLSIQGWNIKSYGYGLKKSKIDSFILQNVFFIRDKDYLFDHKDPNLFSPATRSRIVEFLLKRKRFSEDPDDDFAFGERTFYDVASFSSRSSHTSPQV